MTGSVDDPSDPIAGLELFAGIDRERIAPILGRCATRRLKPGDRLLEPGQSNRSLYLLLEGRLQVRLDSADSAFGFAIETGEMAGEMSVIDGQPATAFVVADRPSAVLVVEDTCLWRELAPVPGIMRNLLRLVSERLRARNEAIFSAQKNRLRFEEMERELATAKELQANMLPRQVPLVAGFAGLDVHALMEPAREVGGDFYDAFALDPHRVCVMVGDVSGKGMSAALFMVRVITLLRSEARSGDPIEAVVARVNEALAADNPTCMFVTLCMVVIDDRTGEGVLLSGGHHPPVARLGDAAWTFLPQPDGPIVGVIEGMRFETGRFRLAPGDWLLMYTDGVTEAENRRLEHYTADRLRDDLQAARPASAEEAVGRVRTRVAEHAGGQAQSDDITIVAVRRIG